MVQLEAEANGWLAWIDDVLVGYLYITENLLVPSALIQKTAAVPFGVYAIVQVIPPGKGAKREWKPDISELQHTYPDPAADLLRTFTSQLGTDFDIPQVSASTRCIVDESSLTKAASQQMGDMESLSFSIRSRNNIRSDRSHPNPHPATALRSPALMAHHD